VTAVAPREDGQLVAAACAGDRIALDTLLRRHHGRIWALCRRLAGNDADAQDATQEALIAIVRGLRSFDGRSAFTTWSYRVATNACLDELRRRARRPAPAETDDVAAVRTGPLPDQVADRLDVDAALAHLPEEFRVAVVLRDLCDLEYADIARILDLPPGTVRSRIARGRAYLARLLTVPQGLVGPDGPERPAARPDGASPGNPAPSTERPSTGS
jgi:RNA polymerase sigma-70 factor (ECF subfamily)